MAIPVLLPAGRRQTLDAALARVMADLSLDTPLGIQLDYLRERVEEPTLPEWCIWLAEALTLDLRLLLLWAEWMGQTEGRGGRCAIMTQMNLAIDLFVRAVSTHPEVQQAMFAVTRENPQWRQPAEIKGARAILSKALGSADDAARAACLRELKRRVLALFPEVVVWEQEFVRAVPLTVKDQDALMVWFDREKKDVEAHGWGKHYKHGSELTVTQDRAPGPVIFGERLCACNLILSEDGRPLAPGATEIRFPPGRG